MYMPDKGHVQFYITDRNLFNLTIFILTGNFFYESLYHVNYIYD